MHLLSSFYLSLAAAAISEVRPAEMKRSGHQFAAFVGGHQDRSSPLSARRSLDISESPPPGGAATKPSDAASSSAGSASWTSGDHISSSGVSDSPVVCSNCTCVPYHRCREFPAEESTTTDRIGTHLLEDPRCPRYLEVFCLIPYEEDAPNAKVMPRTTVEEDVSTCGRRNQMGVGASLDGFKDREAQFGEFTWMAIILEDEDIGFDMVVKRFVCGGSLIHKQVVMTAAHCVTEKNVTSLSVRLGDWDTQSNRELLPYEDYRVVHIVRHRRFHRVNLQNDVALIFLEKPVELRPHIGLLCLPEEDEKFDNSSCVATGFGKDRFDGGRIQNIMKQIDVPYVPYRECQSMLRRTRLGHWFRLHPSFTCAGGEAGVDTCKGDGGSALACPSKEDPNKYVQVGIVSWGIGCGEDGVPGVYASVPKLVKWVKQKIADYFSGL